MLKRNNVSRIPVKDEDLFSLTLFLISPILRPYNKQHGRKSKNTPASRFQCSSLIFENLPSQYCPESLTSGRLYNKPEYDVLF